MNIKAQARNGLALVALMAMGFASAQIDVATIAADAQADLQTVVAAASPFFAYTIVTMLSIRWVRRIFMS